MRLFKRNFAVRVFNVLNNGFGRENLHVSRVAVNNGAHVGGGVVVALIRRDQRGLECVYQYVLADAALFFDSVQCFDKIGFHLNYLSSLCYSKSIHGLISAASLRFMVTSPIFSTLMVKLSPSYPVRTPRSSFFLFMGAYSLT